ncbi:hypothetical protein K435DRAFT_833261 [Dendrothele bispora CBS 962.96]|uniref:Uncharacterized protein n=1 Tax=Dendrothele bispora (strain CBS 962.96) TaxID=1314807 RepID=A0A4S8MX75_DENBC|nr:hypothetical protein K435DRAFT_833261 [Dendrothele bispora CBS 962.96]
MVSLMEDENETLQFCSEAARAIERMNAQINRLQSMLTSITLKRDALRSKVFALRSSSALLLPTELWQLVFRLCLDVFPVISTSSTNLPPILLTHVCRRWRSIALDTPDLWSSLHIVIPKPSSFLLASKCEGIRSATDAFLDRSRDAPLSISLKARDYSGQAPGESPHEVEQILACILPHSKRWKHLKFRMPFSWLVTEATVELSSQDLPLLETVLMDDGYPPFLIGAPSLRQLSLEITAMQTVTLVPCGEWGKIQVLKLFWRHFELNDLFKILSQSTSLRACMVQLLFPSAVDTPLRMETIVMPHLEKLCLTANSGNNLRRILDQLSMSSLQQLYIREHSSLVELNTSLISSFQGFFQRSMCTILKLEIMIARSSSLSLNELANFFRSLSTLQELIIVENMHDDPFMDEHLLQAFTVTSPLIDVLCPRLSKIRFSDRFSFTEQTLLEFVKARSSPYHPSPNPQPDSISSSAGVNEPDSEDLTPLEFIFVRTPRPNFVSRFEKLNLKGVEVVMDSVARFSMISRNTGPSSKEIAIP